MSRAVANQLNLGKPDEILVRLRLAPGLLRMPPMKDMQTNARTICGIPFGNWHALVLTWWEPVT